jgi:hypothetical protein
MTMFNRKLMRDCFADPKGVMGGAEGSVLLASAKGAGPKRVLMWKTRVQGPCPR